MSKIAFVHVEFLMAMSTAVCIGLMVVFGVPLLLCLWRFIKEMIQQVKDAQSYLYEIVDDKRAEYFASYLQEETDKQRTIRETGLEAYQKEKKTAMLKKYGPVAVFAVILIILFILLYPWTMKAGVQLMEKMGVIKNFSFACLTSSIILFLYYLCCQKRHRKKWKACFAIAGFGLLHLAGRLAGIPVPVPVDVVIPVFLALGMFHYNKWSKELHEMSEILEYRLNEKRYAKEAVVQQYKDLLALREQNGYKTGMTQKDNEVDEMLIYLSWLEQVKAR